MASQGLGSPPKCRQCGEVLALSRIPRFCPECGIPDPLGLSQQGSATGLSTSTVRGSTTTASASEGYGTGTNVGTLSSTSLAATRGDSRASLSSLLNQPTSVVLPSREPISAQDAPATNSNEASRVSSGRQLPSVDLRSGQRFSAKDTSAANVTGASREANVRQPHSADLRSGQPISAQDLSTFNLTGVLRQTAPPSTDADADIHMAAPISLEAKMQPLSVHLAHGGRGVTTAASTGASREPLGSQPSSADQRTRQPISAQDTSTINSLGASREPLGRQPSSADQRTRQPISAQDTSTINSLGASRESLGRQPSSADQRTRQPISAQDTSTIDSLGASRESLGRQPSSADQRTSQPISAQDTSTINSLGASRESLGRQLPSADPRTGQPISAQDRSTVNAPGATFRSTSSASYDSPVSVQDATLSSRSGSSVVGEISTATPGGLRETAQSSSKGGADVHQASSGSLENKMQPLSEFPPQGDRDVSSDVSSGGSRETPIRPPTSVDHLSRQPISAQDTAGVDRIGPTFSSTTSASYNSPVSVEDATLSNRSASGVIGEISTATPGGLRQIAPSSTDVGIDVDRASLGSLENKMHPLSVFPPQGGRGVTSDGNSGGSRESPIRPPTSVDHPSRQPVSAQDTAGVHLIGTSRESSSRQLPFAEPGTGQPISAQDTPTVISPGSTFGPTSSASYNSPLSVVDATLSNRSDSSVVGRTSSASTGGLRQTAQSSTEGVTHVHQVSSGSLDNKMQPLSEFPPQGGHGVTSGGSSCTSSSTPNRSSVAGRVAQSVSHSTTGLQANDSRSAILESASAGETFPAVRPPGSSVGSAQSAADLSSSGSPLTESHEVKLSTGGSNGGITSGSATTDSLSLGFSLSLLSEDTPSARSPLNSTRFPNSATDLSTPSNSAGRRVVPSTGYDSNFSMPSTLLEHRKSAFSSQRANPGRNLVTFYVTISSAFPIDALRDQPLIELFAMSSQYREEHELRRMRLFNNHYGWSVDIPFEQLQESDVKYRYAVRQNSSKVSEWLYNRSDQGDESGRDIRFTDIGDAIDDKQKRVPLRYQFGVVLLPPTAAEHDQHQLREEISLGLLYMLPDPFFCLKNGNTADDVLYNFDSVMHDILSSKMFFYRDHQLDQVHLCEVLERYFKDQMKLMEEHREESYLMYMVAVFILLLEVSKVRKHIRGFQYVTNLCSLVPLPRLLREQPSKMLERYFDTSRVGFYDELLDLMKNVAENSSAEWLRLVPFFPEELEEVSPFQMFFRARWFDDKYFEDLIGECITTFKSQQGQDFEVKPWYDLLCDTFEFSPRTGHAVVALCNKEQLRTALAAQLELPIDRCLATFFELGPSISLEDRIEILRHLGALVVKFMEKPLTRYIVRQLQVAYSRMPALSQESLKSVSFNDWCYVAQISNLMAILHQAVAKIRSARAATDSERSLHTARPEGAGGPYEKYVQFVQQWLSEALPAQYADETANARAECSSRLQELQMWDTLFDVTWFHEGPHGPSTVEYWFEELLRIFCDRIHKVSNVEIVDLFCLHNFGNQLFRNEFSRIASVASDAAFKNVPFDYCFERFKGEQSLKKFGGLVSASFMNIWLDSSDELTNLDTILSWPPFLTVIKLNCQSPPLTLHERAVKQADMCAKLLEQLCTDLCDFTGKKITYFRLSILVKHKRVVLAWYQLRMSLNAKSTDISYDLLMKCLELRENEKEGFDKVHSNLRIFSLLCKTLGNVSYVADLNTRLDDEEIKRKPVAVLWSAQDPQKSQSNLPEWSHFPITKTWLSPGILQQICDMYGSLLFGYFWQTNASDFPGSSSKPGAVTERSHIDVKNIWEKSFNDVRKFVERLAYTETSSSSAFIGDTKGATFNDGETFLTAVSSEDHTKIEAEVFRSVSHHTTSNASLRDLRNAITKRLSHYSKLRLYAKAATTVKSLIFQLGLKGNFSELDLLLNMHSDKMRPLSSVTDELVAHGKMLYALAEEERLECLNAFCECMELVRWVRENIKGGVKEVQVFVDLANISTKEGSIDAQKVPILLDALTGYAPLIYDLPDESGLVAFLGACDRLWKNVENIRELPVHLRSINSCIEWLKEIKAAHGEVEQTALEEASAINSRGKYILSNDCDHPNLDNLIRLRLLSEPNAEGGPSTPVKDYLYADVSDLHNKLMLVAGRVEIESPRVEKFVKMYESVLRLGEAYIKMYQSGNVWFRYFNVVFTPSPSTSEDGYHGEVYVHISKDKSSSFSIMGTTKGVPDIAAEAKNIADAIDHCFVEWTDYVDRCRVSISELNFFTISQLSFLQMELAKEQYSSDNRSPTFDKQHEVFHMLALLCQQPEALVKNALRSVSEEKQLSSTEDSSMNRSESSLDIWLLWKSLNEHASMSKAGVLTLEGLGKILHELAGSAPQDQQVGSLIGTQPGEPNLIVYGRRMGILSGEPNLVVCTDREVYATTMSFYYNIVRPTRNEVLVCHEWTSQEEVDLILKRTFEDTNCLYCLVHADRLNLNICSVFERRISEAISSRKVKYNLVVLCTNERSAMVTALQQFKRDVSPKSEGDLRRWLQDDANTSFVLRSKRAGMGKTLAVRRREKHEREKAKYDKKEPPHYISIQLQEQTVDVNAIVEKLHEASNYERRIIHINVTQEVQFGVDEFLFDLIILGSLASKKGTVWQKLSSDCYVVESLLAELEAEGKARSTWEAVHSSLELLHSVVFESPKDCLSFYLNNTTAEQHDFSTVWSIGLVGSQSSRSVYVLDKDHLRSNTWQRAFQYLRMHEKPYYSVNLNKPEENKVDMLSVLLRHCGIEDPSWSELHHFVLFLSSQLKDYETSIFCNSTITGELPGFSSFIIKFLLQMSKDFATRSLVITEESIQSSSASDFETRSLQSSQSSLQNSAASEPCGIMTWKRRWEHNHYPYLFFNSDHTTLTFFDFFIERRNGNLLKPGTREVIENGVITPVLYDALEERGVSLSDDGEGRIRANRNVGHTPSPDKELTPRQEKLSKLIAVMGQGDPSDIPFDPDPKYELTKDNVKKMLAIHMRFRCGIPVIIMGETGCGKTSLIRFMCSLQAPPRAGSVVENLVLMKVHGGVTMEHVIKKVEYAYDLAVKNSQNHPGVDTVLFFDEANTTSAIGLIKEVLCDGTLNGKDFARPFTEVRLRIVAAVNPYRKHSQKMIARLERAGLGFRVKVEETADVFGSIPLRHLVYRVRPLPQSMLPLVWDFGQLKAADEERYIIQLVERHISKWPLPDRKMQDDWKSAVAKVLVKCQEFMRNQKEECSFVSLRDIDRALDVMDWFISKAAHFKKCYENSTKMTISLKSKVLDDITWGLVLALGVCYHACLQPRSRLYFRYSVALCFRRPLYLPDGEKQILCEIERCQNTVINSLTDIPDNIFRNQALKENIFMMVVCIELRIPLFLVGKPGSSKSLAKSLVTSAMLGQNSQSKFFKGLKRAMITSFQCSPLVRSEAIINVFRICARYQQKIVTDNFVSVVVLDEVGLAEDAKHMPLKVLHPLLEDGYIELSPDHLPEASRDALESPTSYKKCAFVGISNWALDPAKMNRGIVVQRGVPSKTELVETAMGICGSSKFGAEALKTQVHNLTSAYLRTFNDCGRQQEFFGLRDFYSLMKMLAHFADQKAGMPTSSQFLHAVLRNFGGLDDDKVIELFKNELKLLERADGNEPPCDAVGLIRSALGGIGARSSIEARYLLLLAENEAALNLVQDILDDNQPEIIFGSKFPKDHDLVQVCRDIHRIKICMEAGKIAVLLNLDRLYESLYDALNQYYTTFGGVNFVDLGLGMQRIKCRIHPNFRLIIIADKHHAYNHFPTALKNRLEKHFIKLDTLLQPDQLRIVKELKLWARRFADEVPNDLMNESATAGSFVGYSEDAPAAVVMQVSDECHRQNRKGDILKEAKYRLLMSATPNAVIRAKQRFSANDFECLYETYFVDQCHDSLHACLRKMVQNAREDLFLQISTHYKLLSRQDLKDVQSEMPLCDIEMTAPLRAFETERQFSKEVRKFFAGRKSGTSIFMIPCEAGGDGNTELIACARYIIKREYESIVSSDTAASVTTMPEARRFVVVLLIQLNNCARVRGFHGGRWINVHVDDLRPPKFSLLEVKEAQNLAIGKLLQAAFKPNAKPGQSTRQSDVVVLLSRCVHEALSRLEETDQTSSDDSIHASHRRLTHLVTIFSPGSANDSVSERFREAFVSNLIKLMVKKDEDEEFRGIHWLYDDAALPANVLQHCTFRRSMEHSIQRRIVPAFAAMVAYIDYDKNLFLLFDSSEPWIKELWLKIFQSDNFFKHFSNSMLDLIATDQKLKVHVMRSGDRNYQTQFPFSWILQEELDGLLKGSNSSFTFSDPVYALENFMHDHPFNKWASGHLKHQQEAVERYISDLLEAWRGSFSEGFTKAVRESVLSKIHPSKYLHIEYVHLYFIRELPNYEKLCELIEVMDEKTDACVKSLESRTNFSDMLKYTMKYLMEDLESSLNAGNTKKWRSRIDDCYCITHDLFESYKEIESTTKRLWNTIVSASLLYDVLSSSMETPSEETSSKEVSDSINEFFMRFKACDLTTCSHFEELKDYLNAKWKTQHLKDVDLSRLHMYMTSDVVLSNLGNSSKELVDCIFKNYVLVSPNANSSTGTRWQTVAFYLYCLLKMTSSPVYDQVCEILGGSIELDEISARIFVSCLELYYRELLTGEPDFAVDKNIVKYIVKLRTVAKWERTPDDFEKHFADHIKRLCSHQSKYQLLWLRDYCVKQGGSGTIPRISEPRSDCVACKKTMWEESCVPTVEQFASDLDNYCLNSDHQKTLKALQLIMERRNEIVTLQYLYDVVDLSVTLQRRFSRQLNEQNVCKMSALTFDRKYAQGGLARHFESFVRAWNSVCVLLKKHTYFYKMKGSHLLERLCQPISTESLMGTFLFTSTEECACPLALATYLAELQNKILAEFVTILDRTPKKVDLLRMKKSHTVLLADVNDLLPVILGNYSFSQPDSGEKGYKFQYEYSSIQERLVNILVRRARQLVIPGPDTSGDTVDLPMFCFLELVLTSEHVQNITILQEPMDVHIKEKIQNMLFRDVSDLRDSCDVVEKGIAFLQYKSAKYSRETSLKVYMDGLNVATGVFMDLMLEKCQLRHIRSLWLLLAFELSKSLAWEGQECFDGVASIYKKPTAHCVDLMDSLRKYLVQQQRALACLLKHFHDFIMLELVTTGQGKRDNDPSDKLFVKLNKFEKGERLPVKSEDDLRNVLKVLDRDFDNIGLEHCVPVWLAIADICRRNP